MAAAIAGVKELCTRYLQHVQNEFVISRYILKKMRYNNTEMKSSCNQVHSEKQEKEKKKKNIDRFGNGIKCTGSCGPEIGSILSMQFVLIGLHLRSDESIYLFYLHSFTF